MTGSLWVPQTRYPDVERQRAFFRTGARRAPADRPEVSDAAFASRIPLAGGNSDRTLLVTGQVESVDADYRLVTGDYFRTLRIPLRSGRTFLESEERPGASVAVVNEEFVRRFLKGRDPLGLTVRLTDGEGALTIVGVVGNIRFVGLDQAPRPELYVPLGPIGRSSTSSCGVRARPRCSRPPFATPSGRRIPEQAFGRLAPMEGLRGPEPRRPQPGDDAPRPRGRAGAPPRRHRHLRGGDPRGRPAHPGARHPDGARGDRRAHPPRAGGQPCARSSAALVGLVGPAPLVSLLRCFLFGVEPHDPLTLLVAAGGLSLLALAARSAPRRAARRQPGVPPRSRCRPTERVRFLGIGRAARAAPHCPPKVPDTFESATIPQAWTHGRGGGTRLANGPRQQPWTSLAKEFETSARSTWPGGARSWWRCSPSESPASSRPPRRWRRAACGSTPSGAGRCSAR